MYYLICREGRWALQYWNALCQRWQGYRNPDCQYKNVVAAQQDLFALNDPKAKVTTALSEVVIPGLISGQPVANLALA